MPIQWVWKHWLGVCRPGWEGQDTDKLRGPSFSVVIMTRGLRLIGAQLQLYFESSSEIESLQALRSESESTGSILKDRRNLLLNLSTITIASIATVTTKLSSGCVFISSLFGLLMRAMRGHRCRVTRLEAALLRKFDRLRDILYVLLGVNEQGTRHKHWLIRYWDLPLLPEGSHLAESLLDVSSPLQLGPFRSFFFF